MEKRTSDPNKAYEYWAGGPPDKNIKLTHGWYWQSAHWSREYIMYLEINAPAEWRAAYIKQNNLMETQTNPGFPQDAPAWFKPGKKFRTLVRAGSGGESVYYEDTLKGMMLIYETQL